MSVRVCTHTALSSASTSSPPQSQTQTAPCALVINRIMPVGTTLRDREREREEVGVCVCLSVSLCVLFTGCSENSKVTIITRLSLKVKCLIFFSMLQYFPSLISRNNYKTISKF